MITEVVNINDLAFKQDVVDAGGKIYSVGGKVRDDFLGKDSKDLDILITGVPFETLEQILAKYGTVNNVGKSFGIIKFKHFNDDEEIDIALPRTEKKTDAGYQGFEVTSDHGLPIEQDLARRDFTINSIARDSGGNIIDPYNGVQDLKDKIIRVTNPDAFAEDPLRMLRAVQFAARFDFTIEPVTLKLIQDNAAKIKEISPERILIEFDKIVTKGDPIAGIYWLNNTLLFQHIFGVQFVGKYTEDFLDVNNMAEFIYACLHRTTINPSTYYKQVLKGDNDTVNNIRALEYLDKIGDNVAYNRLIASIMYKLSPNIANSEFIPDNLRGIFKSFVHGIYPSSISQLAINGNDLIAKGLVGAQIRDMQNSILAAIYSNKLKNDKDDILNFVEN